MLKPLFRGVLAVVAVVTATTLGSRIAQADIYTWADGSGSINVSNLSPPQGVRVISVAHASSESVAARENAAREAARRAETLALEERVRQLESEAAARRQAPTPVVYPVVAAPPRRSYWTEPAPEPVQYSVSMAPSVYTRSCDPGWMDCGVGLFPGFYPTTVVFLRAPTFRRFLATPIRHGFAVGQPVHSFGRFGRG
jgi:hypothetical protein